MNHMESKRRNISPSVMGWNLNSFSAVAKSLKRTLLPGADFHAYQNERLCLEVRASLPGAHQTENNIARGTPVIAATGAMPAFSLVRLASVACGLANAIAGENSISFGCLQVYFLLEGPTLFILFDEMADANTCGIAIESLLA